MLAQLREVPNPPRGTATPLPLPSPTAVAVQARSRSRRLSRARAAAAWAAAVQVDSLFEPLGRLARPADSALQVGRPAGLVTCPAVSALSS